MKLVERSFVTACVLIMSSLLLVFAAHCSSKKEPDESSTKSETEEVTVEKQTRDAAVNEQASYQSFVANPFCRACHLDFDEEELALDHELAGIGCERCHGESERHRSDEDNVTPPEIMYPKAKINPTCMMCHPRHEIQEIEDHGPLLAGAETIFDEDFEASASGAAEAKPCCTDCHGTKHHMKVRIVRWNKATGELIETK
jgi:hypothetical protein